MGEARKKLPPETARQAQETANGSFRSARRRRRRILAVFLCAAAVLAGAAVYLNLPKNYNYVELQTQMDLVLLNSGDIIETIREGLKEHSAAIHIRFSAEGEYMENIADLVSELMDRALEDTGDPKEGDYILYQYGGYTCDYGHEETENGYTYTITITPVYYMNYVQDEAVDEKVTEILSSFSLSEDASDYEKIMAVYAYLYENCEYDQVHKNNDNYKLKCTAYGALIYQRAVCQGMCAAMYRLLRELDVDCRIITGMAEYEGESQYHSWIIAAIDDLYYNVDITWDILDHADTFLLVGGEDFTAHTRDEAFLTDAFCSAYPMAQTDYAQADVTAQRKREVQ